MEVEAQKPQQQQPNGLIKFVAVASIAAGVQFGWALQLSLLTPYVQLLGVPHKWASMIWLCGPISGLLVQPTVGYFSDRCTSRFGRRRPFIVSGSVLVALSVACIGFAADIGTNTGDKVTSGIKPRAVTIFIVGFWILDVANNMLQGPLRAFLADLSNGDSSRIRLSNALYSFFMAVGNVAGYGLGSYGNLYKIFPFTSTQACDVYCANLKTLFIISIALLLALTVVALCLVKEQRFHPASSADTKKGGEGADGVLKAFGKLPRSMRMLMLVTALNWIGWFPFILYNTDWMGKEVYGGDPKSDNYVDGVRAGALGLTIQSVMLGVVSLLIDPLSRLVKMNRLWAGANFVLAVGLALTAAVTKAAQSHRHQYGADSMPSVGIKASALSLFVLLGFPLAVTFSLPFALASIYSNTTGAGQGLSLAILNLAIVIPQMFVSFLSGPWDSLFGGGNLPAFLVGAVAAGVSGVLAWVVLPEPSNKASTSQLDDEH